MRENEIQKKDLMAIGAEGAQRMPEEIEAERKRNDEKEAERHSFAKRLGPHWCGYGSRIPLLALFNSWQRATAVTEPEISLEEIELREKVLVMVRRIQLDTPHWLFTRPHSAYGVTLGEIEVALVLDPDRAPGKLLGLEKISSVIQGLVTDGELEPTERRGAVFYNTPRGSRPKGKVEKADGGSDVPWTDRPGRNCSFKSFRGALERALLGSWQNLPEKRKLMSIFARYDKAKSPSAKKRVLKELRSLGMVKRVPEKYYYRVFDEPVPPRERDA